MLIRFVIYGLLGWNIEILWTGLSSVLKGDYNLIGHTSVWMFFIYATAGILFEKVFKRISHFNWAIRGLIWTTLIFLIEFISGAILRMFGVVAWYYTCPLAIYGLIRLDYAPLWFVVGLLFERIYAGIVRILSVTENSNKRGKL